MNSAPQDYNALRCEWLWVYDGLVPTTGVWSPEITVPPGVFFVLEGHGRIRANGCEHDLPCGTVFFSAPGVRRQWFAPGTRLLSAGFRASWPGGLPLFSSGLNLALPAVEVTGLSQATRRLCRTIHGPRRSITYRQASARPHLSLPEWTAREAAFRAWFAAYVDAVHRLGLQPQVASASDARLREMIRRLDQWPLSKALIVDEISAGLGIGLRRVEQLFKAGHATTPHGYLEQRRIETACRLLVESHAPLKQIAHDVGLRHASHFTKWFRQHVSTTPSAFRRQGGQAV